jgi:hypothetical protein
MVPRAYLTPTQIPLSGSGELPYRCGAGKAKPASLSYR